MPKVRLLKDLSPGARVVRVLPLHTHAVLWRNNGHVVHVNDNRISCEILVDQMRTMDFNTDTGIDTQGIGFGWLEIPGMGAKSKHSALERYDIVQLLWQAKRAFTSDNKRSQQDTLDTLVNGIQGMSSRRRPTNGPVYHRMELIKALYHEKAPLGAMGDLPDIFLDYMTLS